MTDWNWDVVRTQCLQEAERILGRSGTTEAAEESREDEILGQADMERAIAGLSGRDRAVIRGRYWDDLDYRELGRLLHVPEGTARVRLHRALARLREVLVET